MLFLKFDDQDNLLSAILVYVDDFIGVARSDYDLTEVTSLFKWGEHKQLGLNAPVTFKGKELTLTKHHDIFELKISMKTFADGLQSGTTKRGRGPTDLLDETEKKEFRSVAGCLQWITGQARPEVAPAISLHNRGGKTMVSDLKVLYSTVDFLKQTADRGMLVTNVPVNK